MSQSININTDFGEGTGVYPFPMQVWRADFENDGPIFPAKIDILDPALILRMVSCINLSCGYHAGDPLFIKRYAKLAFEQGCQVGAHPSYPDPQGFGNRYMEMSNQEIKAMLQFQIGALDGILQICNLQLHHVKCHGALYNRAIFDESLATSVVEGVAEYRSDLPLFVPPNSAVEHVAIKKGQPIYREAFADRAYEPNGELVNRKKPNAMITNAEEVAERVIRMVKTGEIIAHDGTVLKLDIDTICFHTDTPNIMNNLKQSLQSLTKSGIHVE